MMAPHHERAQLLSVAIQRAVEVLGELLTKIEVTADKVLCSAGLRTLKMSYGYANAYSSDGSAMPGSGRWWVTVDDEVRRDKNDVAWALGRVTGKWLKAKGVLG